MRESLTPIVGIRFGSVALADGAPQAEGIELFRAGDVRPRMVLRPTKSVAGHRVPEVLRQAGLAGWSPRIYRLLLALAAERLGMLPGVGVPGIGGLSSYHVSAIFGASLDATGKAVERMIDDAFDRSDATHGGLCLFAYSGPISNPESIRLADTIRACPLERATGIGIEFDELVAEVAAIRTDLTQPILAREEGSNQVAAPLDDRPTAAASFEEITTLRVATSASEAGKESVVSVPPHERASPPDRHSDGGS